MESTSFDMQNKFAFPYLDDTLVFSDTFDDHLNRLKKVFQRLREKEIKIKASHCKLFQRQVNYLGRVISSDRYQIDHANIKADTDLLIQKPCTVGEVRRLLGLLAYYRRYIDSFAKIAQSLYDLLKKPVSASSQVPMSSQTVAVKKDPSKLNSSTPITWQNHHQKALKKLIHTITSPQLLSYPDFHQPFILHVDASTKRLGCFLYQQTQEKLCILQFGSRALSKAEKRYHSSKLEFLALKWPVCNQSRDYLLYAPKVEVYTDNNHLVYVLALAKLSATGQRWVIELADFILQKHYKPGRKHKDAESLSRFPETYINRPLEQKSQVSMQYLKGSKRSQKMRRLGPVQLIQVKLPQ